MLRFVGEDEEVVGRILVRAKAVQYYKIHINTEITGNTHCPIHILKSCGPRYNLVILWQASNRRR